MKVIGPSDRAADGGLHAGIPSFSRPPAAAYAVFLACRQFQKMTDRPFLSYIHSRLLRRPGHLAARHDRKDQSSWRSAAMMTTLTHSPLT
jgi:hypothetical protein